ncbi:MAG: hypothetical protein AAF629_35235 [Chloroflexota bacterium]
MSYVPHAYNKYELLFTPHLIPSLADLRDETWQNLVKSVSVLPETHPDALAFSWMMIDLGGCSTCEMDSYRAQKGCEMCARQAVVGFKGSDDQLVNQFQQAKSLVADKMDEISLVLSD